MNYFDEVSKLEVSLRKDYQKRFHNMEFFDSYLIGYYGSAIAVLLSQLPEENAKEFLKNRIKGEKP